MSFEIKTLILIYTRNFWCKLQASFSQTFTTPYRFPYFGKEKKAPHAYLLEASSVRTPCRGLKSQNLRTWPTAGSNNKNSWIWIQESKEDRTITSYLLINKEAKGHKIQSYQFSIEMEQAIQVHTSLYTAARVYPVRQKRLFQSTHLWMEHLNLTSNNIINS